MYFVLCCLRVLVLSVFAGYAVSFWLSLRLQMIGVFIITAAAFIAVLEHHFSFIDPGTPQPAPTCVPSVPRTPLISPPNTYVLPFPPLPSPLSPPNTLLSPFLYTPTLPPPLHSPTLIQCFSHTPLPLPSPPHTYVLPSLPLPYPCVSPALPLPSSTHSHTHTP